MSVVRSSEVVRFSEVLNTLVLYGKFNRCFDGYPFYRGHPLLGGSAKRGFTVICYRPMCWLLVLYRLRYSSQSKNFISRAMLVMVITLTNIINIQLKCDDHYQLKIVPTEKSQQQ